MQVMFNRTDTHRVLQVPRFSRTAADAFRGPEYGCAVEVYRLPLLARLFRIFVR